MDEDRLKRKLDDFAKLWLAHDGLWFQAVEQKYGIRAAIELDGVAWRRFSPIEARRIMERCGIKAGGGIDSLIKALPERLYGLLNKQEVLEADGKHAVFVMKTCRVQDTRRRKNLNPFPCKDVGIIEYSEFAKAIDPRIQTECLHCPPDEYNGEFWCKWEFTID